MKAIGTQMRSAPWVSAQVTASGVGNAASGRKTEPGAGCIGIGGAGLAHHVVGAVDDVVPRAPVPVVGAHEVEDARALDVERHVAIVGGLAQEVGASAPSLPPVRS